MKFRNSQILLFILILNFSCSKSVKENNEHLILKASLQEQNVSVNNFFKKAVIIPLETLPESAFRYPEKVRIYNDTIYLFDSSLNSLYIFNINGKYIDKIHRVGQGPGEYVRVCDFLINHYNSTIEMLSPFGFIYKYRMDGKFVKQDDLPKPPMNYRNFELLSKDNYVTWSSVIDDKIGGISIITSDYQLSNSYFPNSSLWGSFIRTVLYTYKDSIYYYESMTNKVYNITAEGYRTAYEWDLGVQIIEPNKLVAPLKVINEAKMKMGEDFEKGIIPFCFNNQFQSERYYYASLRFGLALSAQKSLFYDKLTGESTLFDKTIEGVKIDPVYMNDDYIIGILEYHNRKALHSIVSSSDVDLLNKMKEEDNIWLVKFIFN